jgi:hypothetical protein
LTLSGLLIFRLLYFGYPLPNTYYAKLSPDIFYNLREGMGYFLLFGYLYPVVWLSIIAAVTIFLLNSPRFLISLKLSSKGLDTETTLYIAISIIILVGLFVPVLMGGDNFFLFRLYQPIWPLFPLAVYGVLRLFPIDFQPLFGYGFLVGTAAIFFVTPWANWFSHEYNYGPGFDIAMEGEAVGKALNVMFEEDLPSVGVITAGGIAFAYKGRVFDMMGLNHVAMAHAPGNRYGFKGHAAFNESIFFEQRPLLVLPVLESRNDLDIHWQELYKWDNQALRGLLNENKFLQNYQLILLTKFDKYILTYAERSYVTSLIEQDFEVRLIKDEVSLQKSDSSKAETKPK